MRKTDMKIEDVDTIKVRYNKTIIAEEVTVCVESRKGITKAVSVVCSWTKEIFRNKNQKYLINSLYLQDSKLTLDESTCGLPSGSIRLLEASKSDSKVMRDFELSRQRWSEENSTTMEYDRVSLEDWQRNQPLSVLQLDTADRVVLRVAGMELFFIIIGVDNLIEWGVRGVWIKWLVVYFTVLLFSEGPWMEVKVVCIKVDCILDRKHK